jgi:hypothetical protein
MEVSSVPVILEGSSHLLVLTVIAKGFELAFDPAPHGLYLVAVAE